MPITRTATPVLPRHVPECRRLCARPAGRLLRWTGFVAALWLVVIVSGCSELAQPSEAMQPATEPPYVALAAKYLQSQFKHRMAYDGFEISGVR